MDPRADASDSCGDEEVPSSPSSGGGGDPPPELAEHPHPESQQQAEAEPEPQRQRRNRYDEQKRRDWSTFLRFLENRKPRLTLSRVRSPHVMEFLKSIDGFGKTLVHEQGCPYFGHPDPPNPPCACPLRQSWGSLDALVGRLRAACEDAPSRPETNPFGVRAVRNYLLQVKNAQATARGIPYSRKRKPRLPDTTAAADAPPPPPPPPLLLKEPPVSVEATDEGFRGAATTSTTCVTGKEFITLPEGSVAEAEESSDHPPQEEGSAAATTTAIVTAATTTTTTSTSSVVEGESAATITGASMAAASPSSSSSADPLLGSVGQDVPVQLQICWVRPPVMDNQTTPPFLPIWRYPAMQSLVSFMPPLPYMPTPGPQRTKEKVMRVPKQESQTEEEPLGTREEVPPSSNDGGGGDTTQAVEHTAPLSQQRNRYEEQKRRDWNTFLRFLENRQPRLTLSRVRSPHVIEFLKSIDQFGKTLVHEPGCPYFGQPNPAAPCACPLRQSWGSLDALVGRLRAACEESPNRPETNPFGVRAVRNYLLQVKDSQATARGIPYSRKRKRNLPASSDTIPSQAPSDGESGDGGESAAANTCVISSTCGEEPSTTSTIIPPSASASMMGEESGDIPGGISSIS